MSIMEQRTHAPPIRAWLSCAQGRHDVSNDLARVEHRRGAHLMEPYCEKPADRGSEPIPGSSSSRPTTALCYSLERVDYAKHLASATPEPRSKAGSRTDEGEVWNVPSRVFPSRSVKKAKRPASEEQACAPEDSNRDDVASRYDQRRPLRVIGREGRPCVAGDELKQRVVRKGAVRSRRGGDLDVGHSRVRASSLRSRLRVRVVRRRR